MNKKSMIHFSVLGAAVCAAFAIRAFISLRDCLWYDECLTLMVAAARPGDWWWDYMMTESSPPLFFLLAHWSATFAGATSDLVHANGSSATLADQFAWSIRWISVAAGGLTVWFVGLAGRRFFDIRAGIIAAVYLAIHPFLIWYGAEARPYALLCLTLAGMLLAALDLCFERPWRTDKREGSRAAWLGAALFAFWAAAAMATHYFAVLSVATASAFWAWRLKSTPEKTPSDWSHWYAAHCVLAAVGGTLGAIMLSQAQQGHTDYIPPSSLDDLVRTFLVVFPFGLDAAIFPVLRLAGAGALVAVFFWSFWKLPFFHYLLQKALADSDESNIEEGSAESMLTPNAFLLAMIFLPTLALFLISILLRPIFLYDRYPIMAMPAFALLVGVAAAQAFDLLGEQGKRSETSGGIQRLEAVVIVLAVAVLFVSAGWQAVRFVAPGRTSLRFEWRDVPNKFAERGYPLDQHLALADEEFIALPFRINTGQLPMSSPPNAKNLAGRLFLCTPPYLGQNNQYQGHDVETFFTGPDLVGGLILPTR